MFREKLHNDIKTIIRAATQEDKHDLASLIHFETYVHRHLDYRPPLECMGESPFVVLIQRNEIAAALACPPDPPKIAWIRLFAVSNRITPEKAWKELWPVAQEQLAQYSDLEWVAAIPIYQWFEKLVKQNGFERTHEIVLLRWENQGPPEKPKKPSLAIIRPMSLDDMAGVQAVDHASFVPVWQNSRDYLEIAFRQASVATVAEYEGQIVGYQISTSTPMGAHLARLAVSPDFQGVGVGTNLLHDLLTQYYRRGARAVTVNTQNDNLVSLALYKHSGFLPTGETYPIYQLAIE